MWVCVSLMAVGGHLELFRGRKAITTSEADKGLELLWSVTYTHNFLVNCGKVISTGSPVYLKYVMYIRLLIFWIYWIHSQTFASLPQNVSMTVTTIVCWATVTLWVTSARNWFARRLKWLYLEIYCITGYNLIDVFTFTLPL